MKTAEVRRIFDYLKEHQAPLVEEVAERAQVEKREKTFEIDAQKSSSSRSCASSASTRSWRLDPTVHPFASGTGVTTSASRRGTSPTGSRASSGRCTSSGTASTSTRSTRRSSARRSRAACRSACTSRRAACGRTSSAGRSRSGAASSRALQELFPDALAGHDAESWYRDQRRAAVAHPRRGRRGDLQPAHHPALRARAGDARGRPPARAAARGVEPPMWEYLGIEVPNDTERRPAGHALVERLDRLLPDVRARQRDLRADLGADHRRPARSRRRARGRRLRAAPRLAAREPPPARPQVHTAETLERVVGTPQIDPEPYVRYLREKLAGIYDIAA